MGGFEDLDKDEDTSEEEYISPEDRTKQGYSKATNFVVDDGVVDYNSSSSSPEEEEYEFSDADSEDDDNDGAVNDEEDVPSESGKNKYIADNSDDELEDVELTDPHSELSEEEYEEEGTKEN